MSLPDAVAEFPVCALAIHYYNRYRERVEPVRDLRRLLKLGARALILQRAPTGSQGQATSVHETATCLEEVAFRYDGPDQPGAELYHVLAYNLAELRCA